MNRRHFWHRTGAALLAPSVFAAASQPAHDRDEWVALLWRLVRPVVSALAANELKRRMPVEAVPGHVEKRRPFTHLEAVGRTLAGIAPWLEGTGGSASEAAQRKECLALVQQGLRIITEPGAPDRIDFTAGPQCLVDAAFLALALLRAPRQLWQTLEKPVQERLIAASQSTRKFKPGNNNWLLFSATVEAFLASAGASWNAAPVELALTSHESWYKGDGTYGDGPEFHWDYYNSFVIHPMLLAVLDALKPVDTRWEGRRDILWKRARRFAAVQARLVAPDGTYPALGRSITYRCGAFHHLADMALRRDLPEGLAPAQARAALWAVICRTLEPEGTFDAQGWLRIGLSGHQPSLAETYISTGSLYLCSTAFLPLGLPPEDPFWKAAPSAWEGSRVWAGEDLPPDHALH